MGSEYQNEAEQASFYGVLKTDCTLESARGGWHSGCAHWNCWYQLGLASAAFVSDPSDHQPGRSDYTHKETCSCYVSWRRQDFSCLHPGSLEEHKQGVHPSESLGPHSKTAWVWDLSFSASVPSEALSRGGLAPTVSGGLVCRISHPAVMLASACFPWIHFCLLCQFQQKFQCAPGSRSRMWMVREALQCVLWGHRASPSVFRAA